MYYVYVCAVIKFTEDKYQVASSDPTHCFRSDKWSSCHGYTPSKTVPPHSPSLLFLRLYFCICPICQVVLLSGHLDSWDVGQGAMDDGGGAMISWEALSLIKDLGNIETGQPYRHTHILCMVPHR